jgi:hypothetical protein
VEVVLESGGKLASLLEAQLHSSFSVRHIVGVKATCLVCSSVWRVAGWVTTTSVFVIGSDGHDKECVYGRSDWNDSMQSYIVLSDRKECMRTCLSMCLT